MIATATAEQYRRSIDVLAAWEGIDALIVIFVRPLLTRAEDVAEAVRSAVDGTGAADPGAGGLHVAARTARRWPGAGVPTYLYPEDAARTLAPRRAPRASGERARPRRRPASRTCGRDEAAAVIADALEEGREWLDFERDRAGSSTATASRCRAWRLADDPRGAAHAAEELGRLVALKAHGPEIVHKTELGAVRVGLAGATAGAERGGADGRGARRRRPEPGERSSSRRWSRARRGDAGRRRRRSRLRPRARLRRRRRRAELLNDVAVRISPLTRGRRGRDAPLARDLPAADGLPRRPEVDVGVARGAAAAHQRDGRRPSRDRRAGPQPGDRRRRMASSRWTLASGSQAGAAASPLAQHLEATRQRRLMTPRGAAERPDAARRSPRRSAGRRRGPRARRRRAPPVSKRS